MSKAIKCSSTDLVEQTTIVTFLLDETGSMHSIKDDTIGGFNAYLASLKKLPGQVAFTLLSFDSNAVCKRCVGADVTKVPELTDATYRPGASTPLYDAACKTIKATEEVAAKTPGAKVLVVLQTDGQENASREYTSEDLRNLIKARTADGWEFVFLGCGIDAYDDASSLGIAASNTMAYGRGNSAQAFATMANTTRVYATTGALHIPDADRDAAGDVWRARSRTKHGGVSGGRQSRFRSVIDDIKLTS